MTCDCRDSDRTSIRTSDVLRNVAELELLQAPNLSFIPPKSYSSLPQLKGGHLSLLSLCTTVIAIVLSVYTVVIAVIAMFTTVIVVITSGFTTVS